MDGNSWMVLDHRTNDEVLTVPGTIAVFGISQPKEVRMIRLYQTKRNNHVLSLIALELFGEIFDRDQETAFEIRFSKDEIPPSFLSSFAKSMRHPFVRDTFVRGISNQDARRCPV
jgi:hypothetical protein